MDLRLETVRKTDTINWQANTKNNRCQDKTLKREKSIKNPKYVEGGGVCVCVCVCVCVSGQEERSEAAR